MLTAAESYSSFTAFWRHIPLFWKQQETSFLLQEPHAAAFFLWDHCQAPAYGAS